MDTLAVIYHNLAMLLDGGVPILRAVVTCSSSLHGRIPRAFSTVAQEVKNGTDMAEAMRRFPDVFTEFDVMAVEVGDMSGELGETLEMLSKWHYFCGRIRRMIISGLVFPAFLFHVAVLVGGIPRLVLGRMDLGGYVGHVVGTLVVVYGVGIVLFVLWRMVRYRAFGGALDEALLRVPVLGAAVKELCISRYCRGFYVLLKAGVPISRCGEQALRVTGNLGVARMFKNGASSAKKGHLMSDGLSGELGGEFIGAWMSGEESGELDNVVWKLAENSGDRAHERFERIAFWLPKIVYVMVSIYIIIQIFEGAAAF